MAIDVTVFYTQEQFAALNAEEREAIRYVTDHLGYALYDSEKPEKLPDTETLDEALYILRPCHACIPESCLGGDLLEDIRHKFAAVFYAALQWALDGLGDAGWDEKDLARFTLLIDPSYDCNTKIAVVQDDLKRRPYCYLIERHKAWHFVFDSLPMIAADVIRVRDDLLREIMRHESREAWGD